MITYQANIDVKFQRVSIEHIDKRLALMVHVSSLISFLSVYFYPTSTFSKHPHLSSFQKAVTVEKYVT
jgi:hypothetical protein